jgi:hypothetical protein
MLLITFFNKRFLTSFGMTRNIMDLKEGWRESGSGFAAPALPPTLLKNNCHSERSEES